MVQAGLQFEPEYTEEELVEIEISRKESVENACDRRDASNWCFCEECVVMPTDAESVCCTEVAAVKTISEDNMCITDHQTFENIILSTDSLNILRHHIMLITTEKSKQKSYSIEPVPNSLWRHLAYRQFVYWINSWTSLGKKKQSHNPRLSSE